MKTEEYLSELSYESKMINNNMQRISNLGLFAILSRNLREAKKDGNKNVINLARVGLILVTLLQVIMSISDILNIIQKNEKGSDNRDS